MTPFGFTRQTLWNERTAMLCRAQELDRLVEETETKVANWKSDATSLRVRADHMKVAAEKLGDIDAVTLDGTAHWRERGDPDPHGTRYDCERSELPGADKFSDDEIANAVYLAPTNGNLTAAKERIRWLSRKLVKLCSPAATD
jgi:hypothetical protein